MQGRILKEEEDLANAMKAEVPAFGRMIGLVLCCFALHRWIHASPEVWAVIAPVVGNALCWPL